MPDIIAALPCSAIRLNDIVPRFYSAAKAIFTNTHRLACANLFANSADSASS
jgi:hypothetical protein